MSVSLESTTGPRKRRRTALSCVECRRRKVKCDRKLPYCNRCLEAGDTTLCVYTPRHGKVQHAEDLESDSDVINGVADVPGVDGGLQTPATTTTTTSPNGSHNPHDNEVQQRATGKIQSQTRRIAYLEKTLARLQRSTSKDETDYGAISRLSEDFSGADLTQQKAGQPETLLVKGKGFRTRFYGATSPLGTLVNFPQLAPFMREAYSGASAISQARRELKTFTQRRKIVVGNGSSSTCTLGRTLLDPLPDEETMNKTVDIYLTILEPVFHILHIPTFLTEYAQHRIKPTDTRSEFLVLLLLIKASVSYHCPQDPPLYCGDSSRSRESALRRIEVADHFLANASLKHINLTIMQCHCLSYIAKQVTMMKTKSHYVVAGALLRQGIAAGLHRGINMCHKKQSPFDREMRKRVWATMVDLELQASIDRGAPSMLSGLTFDTLEPLNINDEDFDQNSEKLPDSKSDEHFTHASCLSISRRSLKLRVKIVQLANDHVNFSSLPYSEIMALHDQVTLELDSLPTWPSTPSSTLPRLQLTNQLRQLLLFLHTPFTFAQDISPAHAEFSRNIVLTTTSAIISDYDPLFANPDAASALYAMAIRRDIVRAALMLAHVVFLSLKESEKRGVVGVGERRVLEMVMRSAYVPLLETAVVMLADRVKQLGRGHEEFGMVSGAYSLVMSTLNPAQTAWYQKSSRDHIEKSMTDIIAAQITTDFGNTTSIEPDGNVLNQTPFENSGPVNGDIGKTFDTDGFWSENMENWEFGEYWLFDFDAEVPQDSGV